MEYYIKTKQQMKAILQKSMGQCRIMLTVLALLVCSSIYAQITSVHGTVADDMGGLMGATVCEIDATDGS